MSTAIESPSASRTSADPACERIVAAAIEVFGTLGFAKATVQEISSAAHVSKPLFYRHFTNKQDVFEHVVDRVFADWRHALVDRVDRINAESGSAQIVLGGLLTTALEYGHARPLLGRLLTRDSQVWLASRSDVWDEACDALRELIESILQRGISAGEIRTDLPVDHMSDFLTEVTFVYANRQLLTGIAVEADRVKSVVACMLEGVSHE